MPIYEYECVRCQARFECLLRSSQDAPACPACKNADIKKLVSSFSFASRDASGKTTASSSGCGGCASHNCSGCSR